MTARFDGIALADHLVDEAWSIAMSVTNDEAVAMMGVMRARLTTLHWWSKRNAGVALVLVDEQGAYDRLHDQIRDNEMEIRDARLAYQLARCYDDATRWMIQNMLADRVDHTVRWAMIESFGMGYATLRDCLAYDHGVSYLLACVVAFRLRSIGHGVRGWL